ncbi:O-antigen ligase family protein [Cobetia amphilecti]|uniref:O-antigen ligase family protein n=1 Tax=Cobetia amphilecti TaxID=1055104 RepID=UPI002446E60A|nr:O-antigen ligase family protein [Cobetia litoralis]MDH2421776.1 O-antigen ligase family protein [Cobetia litoralis]
MLHLTRAFPSTEGRLEPRWLMYLGFISLFTYAFSKFIWEDFSDHANNILITTGLIAFCIYGKGIRKTPLLLLLAFILIQLLSWSLGLWQYPQWAIDDPRVKDLAKLFIFISIAWWLGGSTRNTFILWGVAYIGFIVATLLAPENNGWLAGFTGERVGFGIRNKQHAAMLFGVFLLGMICFFKRFWKMGDYRKTRIALWSLGIAIAIAGIVVGQTRAVWLSTVTSVSLGALICIVIALLKGNAKRLILYSAIIFLSLVSLFGIVGSTIGDSISKRALKESGVISQLVEGQFSEIPYTSIGIRVNSWIAASQWIAERPITGWGPKGRELVMSETDWLPDWVLQKFGHLHNYFLETWVEYGLIGVLALAMLALWIGQATWRAWRSGMMPTDIAFFGCLFFVYWIIVNQIESYNSFPTGQFVHNLIVGGLITHYWRTTFSNKDKDQKISLNQDL